MNFWQVFIRVVWWRPLPALGAVWWQLTRRRVRARNRLRVAGGPLPFAYKFWMRNIERPEQLEERASAAPLTWGSKPTFTVIIDGRESNSKALAVTIRSVQRQVYPGSDIIVVGADRNSAEIASHGASRATSLVTAFDACDGDFTVPVLAGDQLSTWALFHFAEALQSQCDASILYGDEDELDGKGARRRPWFKPRWNEELFLARDYLSRAWAIHTACARVAARKAELDRGDWSLDLPLNVTGHARGPVVHVPKIVAHVRDIAAQTDQAERVDAVSRYVATLRGNAGPGPFGSVKVSWPLPDPLPLVSIIVPTRDKLELLRPCIESILERTRYDPFEVVVVNNDSTDPRTLHYFDELRANSKVLIVDHPHRYNYSAINNHAACEARGAFLCLLNNDTEVVEANWLAEMMRYAVRPEIGAVGAKLLYADGTIQHAGVIVGIGDAAGHAHRNLPSDAAGYFSSAHVPQFVSAVTGACLLVDKRKFLAVGGLDEEALPIAYNDVDLCLKLERAGWRNAYVPHAVLIHHESKSRAKDHAPSRIDSYRSELEAFQNRWGAKNYDDPLLNPNLDRSSETFVIRF